VFSSLGDGERFGPWGFAGGEEAPGAKLVYAPDTAEERNIGMFCTGLTVKKGRQIFFFNSGGGGWGDPLERPPEWVLEDVNDEILSPDAAADKFGVMVIQSEKSWSWVLDLQATKQLRTELRSKRASAAAGDGDREHS
jgi:N-methylhydantoinase B